MTNQHPISPPPELRRQWLDNDHFSMVTGTHDLLSITRDRLNSVIDQAAQWGANQELEACCEWLDRRLFGRDEIAAFRAARSPKPPTLKEQALALLSQHNDGWAPSAKEWDTIRRSLEDLDD
jgi:hypothetical protein